MKNGDPIQQIPELITQFSKTLEHRGPNEQGSYYNEGFLVVHRRLSIVDIAQGQQPMLLDGGQVGIAYNGEIYNYKELREELEKKGHQFTTDSDTEVILRLYYEDGPNSFERLEGMFGLFVWDFRIYPEGEFHLVRDHLGIKPLYVYEDDDRIIFSSELRAILGLEGLDLKLSKEGIQNYLVFRYCHAPTTFFERIHRVEAGTRLYIRHGIVYHIRYWDINPRYTMSLLSEEEACKFLTELLFNNVKRQMMGEVPIGVLLSGGVDSSIISYILGELGVSLTTFNIGFVDINEFEYSREIAKTFGLEHIEVITSVDEIKKRFCDVVNAQDEPIADPATFPLYLLCAEIKRHVTVVLSGEGSDEIFAGYHQYQSTLASPPNSPEKKFYEFLQASWYFHNSENLLKKSADPSRILLHRKYFLEADLLNGMLCYDLKTWLPENLMMKADKILMSHSLEGRFPFISPKLIEFALSLPPEYKVKKNIGKYILKKAFANNLPQKIITRPKMGFSVPIDQLVDSSREHIYDLIDGLKNNVLGDSLDQTKVRKLADLFYQKKANIPALRIWTIYVLLAWFDIVYSRCQTSNTKLENVRTNSLSQTKTKEFLWSTTENL